jgi:hypothetical protein
LPNLRVPRRLGPRAGYVLLSAVLRCLLWDPDRLISHTITHAGSPSRWCCLHTDRPGRHLPAASTGPEPGGTVFFLGGGFLELSGRAAAPPAHSMALWLQVRELAAVRRELTGRGVGILREPKREPWGLLEMWIADPDGVRICIVEVPEDHPLRRRD